MVGRTRASARKVLAISVALVTVMGVQDSALAHRFQSTAAARHQQGGTITGKVFADGLPAGYVSLSVAGMGQMNAGMGFSDLMTRVNQEQTEEDGSFSLEGLAPGAYSIDISAPGYIVETGLQDEDGKRVYYRPGDTVTIRMIKGGVITGKVTDSAGQPLVKARVHATRLRDEKGRPSHGSGMRPVGRGSAEADDRGIYRLYGLEPGTYIVSAGGSAPGPFSGSSPLDGDSPVYHPSGTADVAAEVKVTAGQERAGIDISYSPVPGHSVSGHIGGQFATGGFGTIAGVLLTNSRTGMPQAQTVAILGADSHPFVMRGVPDGEYSLTAMSFSVGKDLTLAAPKHVTVKGSDVTGIELLLAPMTAIAGKVVIEPPKQDEKSGCKPAATRLEEIVISPHPAEKSKTTEAAASPDLIGSFTGDSIADGKGDFAVQLLGGGSYHLETGVKDEGLFLNSITLPPEGADKNPKDASAGIAVKTGQRVNGVTVTISHGAASVAGRVVSAAAGSSLPERLRAYLVPVEKEAADNTLRYYEALVRRDGSFDIKHIAPGRYYVAVHALTQDEWDEVNPRPIWWGSGPRRRLRQEAETANLTLEVKPCQQVKDYTVRYPAATR